VCVDWLAWQVKKLSDRVERCQRDVDVTRSAYTTSLNELNSYNAKYMEDMNEVFCRTQDFEARRLAFFKKLLYDYHVCVDATQMTQYANSHCSVAQNMSSLYYSACMLLCVLCFYCASVPFNKGRGLVSPVG